MLALELGGFGSLCSPLQKTMLDRLLPSAAAIQKLEISRMFHMTEADRQMLTSLITSTIRSAPNLNHLNLYGFSYKNNEPEQGQAILDSIRSMQDQISFAYLNLGRNANWWHQEQCLTLLCDLLCSRQVSELKELHMTWCNFTVEVTERVLDKIAQSDMHNTLTTLDLFDSANFDSDQAAQHLC